MLATCIPQCVRPRIYSQKRVLIVPKFRPLRASAKGTVNSTVIHTSIIDLLRWQKNGYEMRAMQRMNAAGTCTCMCNEGRPVGRAWLVGCGPGALDHLTVRSWPMHACMHTSGMARPLVFMALWRSPGSARPCQGTGAMSSRWALI